MLLHLEHGQGLRELMIVKNRLIFAIYSRLISCTIPTCDCLSRVQSLIRLVQYWAIMNNILNFTLCLVSTIHEEIKYLELTSTWFLFLYTGFGTSLTFASQYTLGWAEKLKMSKIYYGHEVPVVIHKNKGISLFTF